MEPIKILLADDHAIVRMGLGALLATEPGLQVVAEAADGEEAVQIATVHHPDLVIMDILMPLLDGIAATREIRRLSPSPAVIVLTSSTAPEDLSSAREAGAQGIVIKSAANDELLAAIDAVCRQRTTYISPDAAQLLEEQRDLPKLTPRQIEVLHSLSRGLTNKDIAKQFGISANCVKLHLANIFTRLGAANRAEAISIALRHRLIRD